MRILLINSMLVLLVCVVAAQADVITMKDTTPSGNGSTVRDAPILSDFPTTNNGVATDERQYSDGHATTHRHSMYWFDLSSLNPAWTINSATFGVYMLRNVSIPDLRLSRFKKDWIEGTKALTAADVGEPTWDSQKHGQALWQVAGATGDNDIDKTSDGTVTFTASTGAGYKTIDVKTLVTGWVKNGYVNNGMLMWSGTGTNYKDIYFSEWATITQRPYLTVDYTVPEPVTVLLLAVGGLVPMMLRRRTRGLS